MPLRRVPFAEGGHFFNYINYDLHNDSASKDSDSESAGKADAFSNENEILEDFKT